MDVNIARIYKRTFENETDISEFLEAVSWIPDRLSAVDVKYRLYQCDEDPKVIFEIWEYPNEDAMEWVQQSMEGASAVPRKFQMNTEIWSTTVRAALDMEE